MRLSVVLLLALFVATPLAAGPWPRPAGEWFLSLSRDSGAISIWGETGIDDSQWLVGQLQRDRGGTVQGMLSWRRTVTRGSGRTRLALSMGGVVRSRGGGLWLRPGALWGLGFERPLPGWVSADLSVALPVGRGRKAEPAGYLTLGFRPVPHVLTMLQLQAERDQMGSRLHLAPSVAWEWREGRHVQLGLRQGLGNSRGRSVTLASWLRF
ncbi:MAG: hypothetical protein JJU19_17150 [Pararhodobacter sp.]|nr:hypothetical protein [Pararhodobacter sp.]